MQRYLKILTKFFLEDIWRIRRDNTSKRQFWVIRIVRIFILAGRRFLVDDCQLKASALTFYSLLSVVPVVALAFGIAKGFGFREALEVELAQRLVGHEEVVAFIQEFALSYLDNAKGGMIAGVGVVILLWSVMNVLGNIEQSFNDVWDIKHSRSFARKFSDYLSFMLVATILMVSSSSVLVFITNKVEGFDLVNFVGPILAYSFPYLMVWIVFTIMFMLMPNTKVKIGSALFGGMIAGTLFLGLQFGYIYFQVGVSKYNAIYGSFAALPLFLIWMQASWLIVLFGAELSFAHQNEQSFEFESDAKNVSIFYRRLVSLLIVKEIVDFFKNQQQAPTLSEISVSLKLPVRLVSEVIYKLEEAQIVIQVGAEGTPREVSYVPAFAIDKMSVNCVIEKLEKYGTSNLHFEETSNYIAIKEVLDSIDQQRLNMKENVLLRDL